MYNFTDDQAGRVKNGNVCSRLLMEKKLLLTSNPAWSLCFSSVLITICEISTHTF